MNFDPTILLCTLFAEIGMAVGYVLSSVHQFISEGRAMFCAFAVALENYMPGDGGRE